MFSRYPIAIIQTPNSSLNNPSPEHSFRVMDRKRYSTCSDTSWFNNDKNLATLNFATSELHIYDFEYKSHSITHKHTLTNLDGLQLDWPEKLAFSPNGSLLAIANIGINSSVNLYRIVNQTIDPSPCNVIYIPNARFHGVAFSADSNYIASTTVNDPGTVYIHKLNISMNREVGVTLSQVIPNRNLPLVSKSVHFSNDGSLLFITYAPANPEHCTTYGAITLHSFHTCTGKVLPDPIFTLTERPYISYPEDIALSHNSAAPFVIIPSQANDTVMFHPFDRNERRIKEATFTLGPETGLNFPHGIALSSDDQFLAVANNGDDKVVIFQRNSNL